MARNDDRPGLMIVGKIDGGDGLLDRALRAVEDGVAALPPPMRPRDGESFHITIRHAEKCPARESRDQAECLCESLIVEAVLLTEGEALAFEMTGSHDACIDNRPDQEAN